MSFQVIHVLSGVGQGTHLSPLFFICFINDINLFVKFCKLLLFADDVKLYKVIKAFNDRLLLQCDLSSIYEWALLNGMDFNVSKCYSITFGRGCINDNDYFYYYIDVAKLEKVNQVKDLGVLFDSDLSFRSHIDYVRTACLKRVGFLKRSAKNLKRITSFRALYYSFVFPLLSYCSPIWFPYFAYEIQCLEKINHLFLRFVAWRINIPMHYFNHDYSHIATRLSIPSVQSAFIRSDFIFIFRAISNLFDCTEILNRLNFHVPGRILRQNSLYFNFPLASNFFVRRSPLYRGCNTVNIRSDTLVIDLFNSNLWAVKVATREFFVFE